MVVEKEQTTYFRVCKDSIHVIVRHCLQDEEIFFVIMSVCGPNSLVLRIRLAILSSHLHI
jgi:hypothetical protein